MLPDNLTDLPTVNTLIGPVAKGSILHTQLKRFGTTTVNNNVQSTSTSSILQFSQLNKVNDQSQHSDRGVTSSIRLGGCYNILPDKMGVVYKVNNRYDSSDVC